MEPFFAYIFPDVRDGIQLGTIGWLWDEANVLWDLARMGGVPPRSINLHHKKGVRKHGGHMVQEEMHHRRIRLGQNERGHAAQLWCHGRISLDVLAHDLAWRLWSHSRWCPTAFGRADAAATALILSHF